MILNFFKKTRTHNSLQSIVYNYVTGTFFLDLLSAVPIFCFNINKVFLKYYWLRFFRNVHLFDITYPFEVVMLRLLHKHSKKRQSDLISFAVLILMVLYLSHIMACVWISLGLNEKCDLPTTPDNCTLSWVYYNGFDDYPDRSKYIFALYWIIEVITTVGYGDFYGRTTSEYMFSIMVEFLGLTYFSFLMGCISRLFNVSDSFDDFIEEKLDTLDMWIKKIEKSNKPYHI